MKKKVNTMLEDDTIEHLTKEAKEKSISVSAVIRQKVEASYKQDIEVSLVQYNTLDSDGNVFIKGCFDESIKKQFYESKTTLKTHKPNKTCLKP